MPRPKGSTYDPQAIAWAVNEVSKGRSYRDVSEELAELKVKASHQTVKRWCAEAAQPKEPTPLATRVKAQRERAEQPPPEPPVDDGAPFDLEATLQRLMRQAEAEAKSMDQASNARGAQAAARRATEMAKVLAVIDKRKPADPDVLMFSSAEIEREYAALRREIAEKIAAQPLVCSGCGRAMRIKWGQGN
jgi:hypothetical protein